MNARTVLAAAVTFALGMGALEHGGWWWAWFIVALALWKRLGLPFGVKLSPTNRFILRENRKTRRRQHRAIWQQRRAQRQKPLKTKRSSGTPL